MHKWKFQGKTAHWVTMTTCHFVPEITFTSMHDTCKVTVSGDSAKFKDLKLLTQLIFEEMNSDDW